MAVVVVLSVVFILCPLLGYIVLISNFTLRQKIVIGFVGVFSHDGSASYHPVLHRK